MILDYSFAVMNANLFLFLNVQPMNKWNQLREEILVWIYSTGEGGDLQSQTAAVVEKKNCRSWMKCVLQFNKEPVLVQLERETWNQKVYNCIFKVALQARKSLLAWYHQ